VELMVTLAVLVITSLMVAPAVQRFIAKSEMYALQNDFTHVLSRARSQAAARNTCVTLCQLADGSTNACNTADATKGQWQRGWILFENPACTTPAAAVLADMTGAKAVEANISVITVRQPGSGRFTLASKNPAAANSLLTYNAMGILRAAPDTFLLRDTADESLSLATDLTLNSQGRVHVSKYDPVAGAPGTAAGQRSDAWGQSPEPEPAPAPAPATGDEE
jgi:type IV fimbrial biogenesis protein FimT